MQDLLEQLHDPRYHDSILRHYPTAKIQYGGPHAVPEHMPKYATVCANEVTFVTQVAARSEPDFEINEDWFIAAVYDLDTGERVDED